MNVFWTEQSYERLKEIRDYISDKDSSLKANRLIEKLIERGNSLSEFQNRGRIVPELGLEDLRELLEQNYRIIYRVKQNKVQILSVFEAHRLLQEKDIH